ncbi:alpha/beta hydrolase [Streptobacillus felis]|uniref:Alpha/beta hydrolase n=1 Tax=Streptobacillus felis TaxID=1384509 RepID=A0A7Z0PEN5_9FUSO|nr:alpha/beta hydrolase [Streptobacillus felis]NYV27879.1 alpha/beta hydrolase [Streptobacillus felis]
MKKKIFLIITVVFTMLYFGIGNYFYNISINASTNKSKVSKQDFDGRVDNELEQNVAWFEENKVRINMESTTGFKLVGYKFVNKDTNNWVVMVHGFNSDSRELATHIRELYNLGYSVFSPDLISFGESEGTYISMGGKDSLDIAKWIDLLHVDYTDAKFALFGRSMGAATVLNSLEEVKDKNVVAFIEDSGYLTLRSIFAYQLKKLYSLPQFPILDMANTMVKIRAGYSIDDVDATNDIKQTKIPGLILHGSEDGFVPLDNSKKIYDLLNSEKEIVIFEDAKHVQAHYLYKDKYWSTVKVFLEDKLK